MSNPHSAKPPSQRQLRVGEEIRHVLSDILMRGECHSQELRGRSITISEVRISPDLKNATVYFMPLGGQGKEETAKALNSVHGELRYLVGRRMQLRYCPKLHFKLDNTFEEANRINAILHHPDVARDLRKEEE